MAHRKSQFKSIGSIIALISSVFVLVIGLSIVDQKISTKINASQFHSQKLNRSIQQIPLNNGWNLISFNVIPNSPQISDVFKNLLAQKYKPFVMAKNNAGKVYWPEYNIDEIGAMNPEEAYWVFVNQPTRLMVFGKPIPLPFTLNLKSGWNSMSYPKTQPKNALRVLAPLITANNLVEVRDINDRTIRKVDGKWVNQIGNFVPGEGYQINVSSDSLFEIR